MTRTSSAVLVWAVSLILTALYVPGVGGGTSAGVPALAGKFTRIDVPGGQLTQVLGINATGEIVGWYWDAGFSAHGFLLSNQKFSTIDAPGSDLTQVLGINSNGDM